LHSPIDEQTIPTPLKPINRFAVNFMSGDVLTTTQEDKTNINCLQVPKILNTNEIKFATKKEEH